MKSKLTLFTLTALSLVGLYACNETSSSVSTNTSNETSTSEGTSSSNTSSTDTSTSETVTDWTAEQKEVFTTHFNSYVLPFYNVGQVDVFYDETYECISVTSKTNVAYSNVAAYANFLISQNYEDVTAENEFLTGVGYELYYDVSDLEYVYVDIYMVDSLEAFNFVTEGEGVLLIDVYYYTLDTTWPGEAVSTFLTSLSLDDVSVPALEVENAAYEYLAYPDALIIYAYNGDYTTTYSEALKAASWTVSGSEAEGFLGTDANNKVDIFYMYDADYNLTAFVIGEHVAAPATSWPAEEIAAELDKAGYNCPTIPAYDGFTSTTVVPFNPEDGSIGIEGYCETSEDVNAAYDAYKAVVSAEGTGWTIAEDALGAFIAVDQYNYMLLVATYDDYLYIEVYAPESATHNLIDFAVETNIVGEKNEELTTWANDVVTMTVAKNGSQQTVGNNSYFSNPLRIYTSQLVTFTVSEGNNLLSFTIQTTGTNYAEALATSTAWTNARVVLNDTSVVVFPVDATAPVTFTAPSQVRFTSLDAFVTPVE